MAVEQTVKICRNNAKSGLVKAILASTVFSEPKDVVAKLIVEESATEHEHQVLSLRYNRPNWGQNRNNYNWRNNNSYRTNSFNNRNTRTNRLNTNYRGNNNYRVRE